jgi:hypothetical protein
MFTENLATLFERELLKLKTEIESYKNTERLWVVSGAISNSGGNLCLHLAGNLQYFIGNVLGKTGYIRNRPEEFSFKNVPLPEMIGTIEKTIRVVPAAIRSLTPEQLAAPYPEKVFENPMTVEYFLLHLYAHLNYHLGQINYHRRLLDI